MKTNRKFLVSVIWIILGIGLIAAGFVTELDEFWNGAGTALIVVGVLQLVRWGKYHHDTEYREKRNIEAKDERNRYLAMKAWSWAAYLFVIISAAAVFILRVMGQELMSTAAACALCTILVVYWVSYFLLKRKY